MAYTINLTDGSIFATVADGTINTDSSVTIIGKNYAGYGEFIGENFVRLLENGANTTAPANPLTGQLWYDSSAGLLKVYNGTTFKNLGAASSSATAPTSNVVGDLWFDTANSQLKVYDGSGFILVGPAFTAGTGTSGAIVDTITDNLAVDHIVVKTFVNDDIVAIMSKDAEFTPAAAIPGFTSIKPGQNLASSIAGETPLFQGTATNAQLLDNFDSSQFLRSDTNDSTTGTLGVLADGGVTIGADSDAKISVTGANVTIENQTATGNLILQVNGAPDVLTIDAASGKALVNGAPIAANGIATKDYVDSTTSGASSTALQRDGSNTITGHILPAADLTYNLGAVASRFDTIYADIFNGRATTAQYADLAERFEADTAMVPGTVVELGGTAEITTAMDELTENVFGVISTNPGFLMNDGAGDNSTHPSVAMSGRVPVRVIGTINKGDRLVSAGNGLARAAQPDEATPFNVIGRALETKTSTGEGTIEAIVTVK